MPKVIRTYSSRSKKKPLVDSLSLNSTPVSLKSTHRPPEKHKKKSLTQLHFCIDQSILRTCLRCNLSYTKGAPDDEALHRAHCTRVQKGMEWGREEAKEMTKAAVAEVATGVGLNDGRKGRIISFKADVGGKIGNKTTTLLETINLTLSAPPLTPSTLQASKIYLFLLPPTSASSREKIVGCVVAQRITTAMAIVSPREYGCTGKSQDPSSLPTQSLVAVDTNTGLFCHPNLLPTPLGIPRLFVPSTHRRQGIASRLLSAVAESFIHGCPLDPRRGQVAFSQPTGDGAAVMRAWGEGGVRIYEE